VVQALRIWQRKVDGTDTAAMLSAAAELNGRTISRAESESLEQDTTATATMLRNKVQGSEQQDTAVTATVLRAGVQGVKVSCGEAGDN
jgi:hypothetical protein